MQDSIQISKVVRFETFELNLRTGELRKGGVRIRLQEQSFQILAALLDRPGKLVTREALRERLWPDGTFVDFDHSLNTAVANIRVLEFLHFLLKTDSRDNFCGGILIGQTNSHHSITEELLAPVQRSQPAGVPLLGA